MKMVVVTENRENGPEYENNKIFIQTLASEDGKLVSPIDLSLEISKPISLPKLRWMNFNEAPFKMKVTNTGETVIISAKWESIRPYIVGGPLDGNYVFSQIHFHWGSDEHEGSEHTIKGICYPMEMHVVFYKTRYLTQEAALKHVDGIVTMVYLMKLQKTSAAGLRWLTSHLEKVVEPQKSVMLPLSPISSLIVPFTRDYIMYWGSLTSSRCSHTMQWLVSRAALSINVDDLNMFRRLLNSRKEAMNKNFRNASHHQGRSVFHVDPSTETSHLLLPGCVDPPGGSLIVNFFQMSTLNQSEAEKIFCRGDATDDSSDQMSTDTIKSTILNKTLSNSKTYVFCEGLNRGVENGVNKLTRKSSTTKSNYSSNESCSFKNRPIPPRPRSSQVKKNINEELLRTKFQKKRHAISRKNLEKERRLEMEKRKMKTQKKNEDARQNSNHFGKYLHSSSHRSISSRLGQPYTLSRCNKLRQTKELTMEVEQEDKKKEDERNIEFCLHLPSSKKSSGTIEETSTTSVKNEAVNNDEVLEENKEVQKKETTTKKGSSQFKSKLPVRTAGNRPVLQSSLAQYFTNERSDSDPRSKSPRKKAMEEKPATPRLSDEKRPITTIPRPIGKNAGKLDGSGNTLEAKYDTVGKNLR